MRTLLVAAAASMLAACTGTGSGGTDSSWLTGSRGSEGSVPIPSDTRRSGREGITPRVAAAPETETERAARHQRSVATAEALWNRAEAQETSNPAAAAGLYRDLAEGHPDSPRAAEAKFREGRARYRAHDYAESFTALKRYMEVAPTNQHLAEVEELVYRVGVEYLATLRGLRAVFQTKATGYEALQYVAQTFPNGAYADDALLALGEAYRLEGDNEGWVRAVLAYKLLLLRYPECPLAPGTHLGLGGVYLARDQGARYNAGFTELDPREDLPTDMEQAALLGPVVSGAELALEQFEAVLDSHCATPAERARAESGAAQARARIAAKERRTAAWYARRGSSAAAEPYTRSAEELEGPRTGSKTAPEVRVLPPSTGSGPSAPAPTRTPPTPTPPAPRVVPPAPPQTPRATPPPTSPTLPGAQDPTLTAPPPGLPAALPPPAARRLPGATSGSQ